MPSLDLFGVTLTTGQSAPPTPDNENRRLLPDWMTPAELMQWVRQEKQRLARELAVNPGLWHCPEHRREWDATLGIEKLALSQCYGMREG